MAQAAKALGKAVEKTVESVKDKLAPTAVALGLISESEEAEASYIPLKAFAEGSEAAQALFKKAQKRIAEGADTRPNGELYNEMGVYRSEDGDLKVDVAELSARNVEKLQGLQKFAEDADFYLSTHTKRNKKFEYPITRYLGEDSPIFVNFPDLKEATVHLRPRPKGSGLLGEYINDNKEIIVYIDNDPRIDYSEFPDQRADQILSSFNTLIHEFQHHIQDVKKAANTGYNEVASLVAMKGFRDDYKDAVEALEKLQPGDVGYDQFKNKVDSVFGMVQKSFSAYPKSKGADSKRDKFLKASYEDKLKMVEDALDNFERGSSLKTDDIFERSELGHNIYIRELGEAEARSTGLKTLIPEGSDRKAVGVFYPTSSGKQTVLRAEDVSLSNRLDPSHVLVRATPAYEDTIRMNKLYFPESIMGQEAVDPEIVKQAQKKKGDGGKGTAAVVSGGTAAGLASPPSEAFVEDLGERTGLFEDGSPTASLFDVEGVSDELGISNTFMLDLLIPRTKPYDLISNIPGVGETMMAADVAQGLGSPDAETPDEFTDVPKDVAGMRQGGGIETEAGLEMEEKNPNKPIPKKADINKDGEIEGWEKARHEAIQKTKEKTEMAMGGSVMGMMSDPFAPLQVTVDIDEESGNEVPAGSKEEEVRDDIPAMLSEGEYVVPADVVRYHGLKTFEALRCEAKNALGLMAMHDRISFVDDETKEPVEYDIEEKDLPEVEEAEVEVIEAADGTDVQPATEPTTFYQLQYKTDPVTGQVRIVYVDPLTGQEVKREEYEEERASRFAPQKLLEREVFTPGEEVAEEEEEEKKEPLVPLPVDDGGDEPEPTEAVTRNLGNQFGYTRETLPVALSLLGGPLTGAVKFAQNVNNAVATSEARKALGLEPLSFIEQLGAGFTGNYNEGLVGDVTIGQTDYTVSLGEGREDGGAAGGGVYDISTGKMLTSPEEITAAGRNARTTLTVAEAQRRQQMAEQGAGFPTETPTTTPEFDPLTAMELETEAEERGLSDSDRDTDLGPGESPTGDDTKGTPFAKGGMATRKNTPLVAMMKY